MTNIVKSLIEKHINEIEEDNFVNLIADAAKEGIDCVIDLRNAIKKAGIEELDEQFAKTLINYSEIIKNRDEIVKNYNEFVKLIR